MITKRGRLGLAGIASGLVILAGCSGPAHPGPESGAVRGSGSSRSVSLSPPPASPQIILTDEAARASCPSAVPRGAECFRIELSGTSAILGDVTSGGWLDVEVASTSRACGQTTHHRERVVSTRGWLTVRVSGPRLCLGAVGSTRYKYAVLKAGGGLRSLHGTGSITLNVMNVGATETWTRPAR